MQENLNVGTRINSGSGGQVQTDNDTIEKFCYNDNDSLCEIYGGLYEWDEIFSQSTIDYHVHVQIKDFGTQGRD